MKQWTPIVLLLCAGCELLQPELVVGRERPDAGVIAPKDAGSADLDMGTTPRDAGTFDASPTSVNLSIAAPISDSAFATPGRRWGLSVRVQREDNKNFSLDTVLRVMLLPPDNLPGRAAIEVAFASVEDLGPNEQRTVVIDGWIAPGSVPALYTLSATIDPDNVIAEFNESDNQAFGPSISVSTLRVAPGDVDFGTVGVGCSAVKTVVLTQLGQTPAFVSSAELRRAHSDFSLQAAPLPQRLEPGSDMRLDVRFSPLAVSDAQAVLAVAHDQSLDTFEVPIRGRSTLRPERSEEFSQLSSARIDILFVVDDSASMIEERERLAAHAPDFVRQLQERQLDFHIGVTTTDVSSSGQRGAFIAPYITPSTANAAQRFAEAVQVGLSGATSEQGLEAARLALSEPMTSGANAGFLRADASLAFVFLSDEDDASPDPVDTYGNFFVQLKRPGGDHRVVANAVVGPNPNGCPDALAGTRYLALVQRTQGVFESVCAFAWPTALQNFPGRGFGYLNQFALSHPPLPGTLEVWLDGQPIPERDQGRTNWFLNLGPAPTLVFDGLAVPEPGARIEVRYRSEC